ncbi:hypothetical protein M3Y96_00085900 [Aphelenchoides besseyi]|nr:hypothetical protein M3Y96_00085900 [Aphelenchoides besseyi]
MIVGLSMQTPIEGLEMNVYEQPDDEVTIVEPPAKLTSSFASRSIISKFRLVINSTNFLSST